jgi:methylase of polypeptide subunit release factors
VLDGAASRLRPGGTVIFEFGLGQDDEIRDLVATYGIYRMLYIKDDLQGIPRTAVVQLTSNHGHDRS